MLRQGYLGHLFWCWSHSLDSCTCGSFSSRLRQFKTSLHSYESAVDCLRAARLHSYFACPGQQKPSIERAIFRGPYVRDPVILGCRAPLKGFRVDIRQV